MVCSMLQRTYGRVKRVLDVYILARVARHRICIMSEVMHLEGCLCNVASAVTASEITGSESHRPPFHQQGFPFVYFMLRTDFCLYVQGIRQRLSQLDQRDIFSQHSERSYRFACAKLNALGLRM